MDAQRPIDAREDVWAAISRVARRQLGLITRPQLLELGLGTRSILRWVAARRLAEILPRVYALAAVRPSWEQRALASLYWTSDGILCGLSAARVWRLDVDPGEQVDVVVRRHLHAPRQWLIVKQSTNGMAIPARKVEGLRVTSIERTLLDLAAKVSGELLEEALE